MKQVIITLLAASVLFCACGGNTEVNEQQAAVVNNEVQWTDSVIAMCEEETSRNLIHLSPPTRGDFATSVHRVRWNRWR